MNTQTTLPDNITEEVAKQLAFMQYNNEEYFTLEDHDEIYIGNEDEAREKYEGQYPFELMDDNTPTFAEFVDTNYDQVQDFDNDDYLILTDEEADDAWEESLDRYIDECVLPEIPKAYRYYFDDEAFKNDCKIDGRCHSLASYDGHENEETVNGTTYYIYRIN